MASTVEEARKAFAGQAWADACALLVAVDPLSGNDLERLGVAGGLCLEEGLEDGCEWGSRLFRAGAHPLHYPGACAVAAMI